MNLTRVRTALLPALALILVACAPSTKLEKLYEHSSAGSQQFERILVVGLAADAETRRGLESLIAGELGDAGVVATPANMLLAPTETVGKSQIDAAAERTGADAILVTHIVSIDTKAETKEGRSDIISECRGGDPADYFLYDYEELKEPDSLKLSHTVVAVTNLYKADDGQRIWSIQSTCFERETFKEALSVEAEAIARQLRIDKLID